MPALDAAAESERCVTHFPFHACILQLHTVERVTYVAGMVKLALVCGRLAYAVYM